MPATIARIRRSMEQEFHYGSDVPAYEFCPDPDAWKCEEVYSYTEGPSQAKVASISDKKREFKLLVELWRKETRRSSVVAIRYTHPAYQRILAMGSEVVPWIIEELKTRPDRWFAALYALTKAEPCPPSATFDEAIQAWIDWGDGQLFNV